MIRLGNPLLAGQGQPCTRVGPHCRRHPQPVRAALLDPPPFDPSKLRVEYLPGGREGGVTPGRRYTLTHNDVTGSLQLAIGREYNRRQLDGWYTRILRDEILAEWQDMPAPDPRGGSSYGSPGSSSGRGEDCLHGVDGGINCAAVPSLHVYCHVSGEELWPAPPQLRNFIFQREMTLVLDTISHAETAVLDGAPGLRAAPVYVHLRSDVPALDRVVEWGVLGDRGTWRTARSSMMRLLLSSVMGIMDEGDTTATDGSSGSWSRTAFSDAAAGGSWDGGAPGGVSWCGGSWESSGGWGGGDGALGVMASEVQQQVQQQQQRPPLAACDSSMEEEEAAIASISTAVPPPPACSQPSSAVVVGSTPTTGAGASSAATGSNSALGATNGAVSLIADCPNWLSPSADAADTRQRARGRRSGGADSCQQPH